MPCGERAKRRCRALIDEVAEPLVRAALDERGVAGCAKLVSGCDQSRLAQLAALEARSAANTTGTESGTQSGDERSRDAGKPAQKDEV